MNTAVKADGMDAVRAYNAALATGDEQGVDPALERAAEEALVAAALATCPEWCTVDHDKVIRECLPTGYYEHGQVFTEIEWNDGDWNRALYVAVIQRHPLLAANRPGPVLHVFGDTNCDLDAAQAAEFARHVTRAARLLEQIVCGCRGCREVASA